MIPISRPTFLAALAVLATAAPTLAQDPAPPPPTPLRVYGGLSVGPHVYPKAIEPGCGGSSFGVGGAQVGVASGPFAVEVRATAVLAYASTVCALAVAGLSPPPQDGVHTSRDYDFSDEDPTASFDARLRFGGTRTMPLAVTFGGGRLVGPGVNYLVASVGVRSRGTTRVAVDLQGDLYRTPYDRVTVEVRDGQVVGPVSRVSHVSWEGGAGVRIGVERDLF